jgi:p-cumate 2,3-dioxygenase ferredoxin subunit
MDISAYEIVTVCRKDELAPGEMRLIEPPDRDPIAVYNVAGEFYATDDFCSHGQASLSQEGLLDGHIVECSWHLGSFDVRNGEPIAPPCQIALRTYQVVLEGDNICVKLDRRKA